jgi:hypothetical protein
MNRGATAILLFIIIGVFYPIPVSADDVIPLKPDSFYFRLTHKLVEKKQVEHIFFVCSDKKYIKALLIDHKGQKKKPEIKSSRPIEDTKQLIKILNHAGFMRQNSFPSGTKPHNIKTMTEFELKYTHKGRTFYKYVSVPNIDELCLNPANTNALKIKAIMIYTEPIKYDLCINQCEGRK